LLQSELERKKTKTLNSGPSFHTKPTSLKAHQTSASTIIYLVKRLFFNHNQVIQTFIMNPSQRKVKEDMEALEEDWAGSRRSKAEDVDPLQAELTAVRTKLIQLHDSLNMFLAMPQNVPWYRIQNLINFQRS
jgi:hypothetical protein